MGRNYFSRPSAEQDDLDDIEGRALVLEEMKQLKKLAVDYLRSEKPVVTSDPFATGRNYFTRPSAETYEDEAEKMNDQLLQWMERSLYGSLANVENLARKGLISPSQALCLHIQELAGLVQFHATSSDDSAPLLQALVDASHHLWVSVEALLTSILTSRFRVRDLCGCWLAAKRGISSQSEGHSPKIGPTGKCYETTCPPGCIGTTPCGFEYQENARQTNGSCGTTIEHDCIGM